MENHDTLSSDRGRKRQARWSRLGASAAQNGPIWLISFVVLVSGAFTLFYALLGRYPVPAGLANPLAPTSVFHWHRALEIVQGFGFVYLSFHLIRRRRLAWGLTLGALICSILVHLYVWRLALAPALLLVLLLIFRGRFAVRGEPRGIIRGLLLSAGTLIVALLIGAVGFEFLDRSDFGTDFGLSQATWRALKQLILIGNSDLTTYTPHAAWFLEGLSLLGILAAVLAAVSFFRPVTHRLATLPHERQRAHELLSEFGGSSYGHFTTAPDKSFFFSASGRSFVAYRVVYHVALALGDPVGPAEETGKAAAAFVAYARKNGWTAAFLMPDRVTLYRELGLSVLKIGEEAVVDLERFSAGTSKGRRFRYIKRKLGGEGYSCERYPPPHPPELLEEMEDVSREWLGLPHHREYGFHQGCFDREVLAHTPIFGLREPGARMIAFVSQVPSHRAGEAKGDLMRRRPGIHCRGMDLVFTEMLLCLRDEGYRTFNLGLAPFAGVGESADSPLLERIMHGVGGRVGWFAGLGRLRQYKNKFEPAWEDRFLVYDGGLFALPRISLAMTRSL